MSLASRPLGADLPGPISERAFQIHGHRLPVVLRGILDQEDGYLMWERITWSAVPNPLVCINHRPWEVHRLMLTIWSPGDFTAVSKYLRSCFVPKFISLSVI